MYPEECKNIKDVVRATYHKSMIRDLMSKEKEYSYSLFMHGIATAVYAGAVAKLLMYQDNLTNVTLDQIVAGAMIHDIGKVYINHAIIDKTGKLTENELGQIKMHPVLGAEIVQIHDPVVHNIIRGHHEKMNGSGYPDGITDIPDYVRIVTIADIYDALTSARSYKRIYTHKEAIKIMRKEAATGQIDMDILCGLDLVINNGALARK